MGCVCKQPSAPGTTELGKSRWGCPRAASVCSESKPHQQGEESQQPGTGSSRSLPAALPSASPLFSPKKHFLSGRRTSHPPAPRLWPPGSKPQWPGGRTPPAQPCRELDAAGKRQPPGPGSLPGCPGRSRRSHGSLARGAAPYVPHPLRWNPATGDGGGDPAAPPAPCPAKGAGAGGSGAGARFPPHALHRRRLVRGDSAPRVLLHTSAFLPRRNPACCCCRYLWACLSDLRGARPYL